MANNKLKGKKQLSRLAGRIKDFDVNCQKTATRFHKPGSNRK